MEVIRSQKGNHKVIYNGYIYVYQKELANDLRSFECENRRKGQCKAKVKVDLNDDIVAELNEHTHPPSQEKVALVKVKTNLKRRAETSLEPVNRIIADELAMASATTSANLPRLENLRRTLRHQRQDNDRPPNPIARGAIPELPPPYQQTSNGERFLLFDSGIGDENRIIIFATDQALQLMRNSEDWFCDGTFSVCPQIFFQLYTVHSRIGQKIFPCIFALLPNKTRQTYTRLFTEISNHCHVDNVPSTILFDFELAAINAVLGVFPNAEISGCFFHLSSNVWKKIQSIGLQDHYNNDAEFALHLRMICALAFLPPDDVINVFERLTDLIQDQYGEEANLLIDYFESTYIGRFRRNAPRAAPMFQLRMWNMFHRTHQEMPRTNNHVEGWHRRFQGLCMCHHPSLWKFLEVLKKEESLGRAEINQFEAGHPAPAQRRIYLNNNERILTLVDDFPNRDNIQYLRGIAHNIAF